MQLLPTQTSGIWDMCQDSWTLLSGFNCGTSTATPESIIQFESLSGPSGTPRKGIFVKAYKFVVFIAWQADRIMNRIRGGTKCMEESNMPQGRSLARPHQKVNLQKLAKLTRAADVVHSVLVMKIPCSCRTALPPWWLPHTTGMMRSALAVSI
jgi:hypothetical protein